MSDLTYDELVRENFETKKQLDFQIRAYKGSQKALSSWMNAYHKINKKEGLANMNRKIHLFKDKDGDWRWNVRNGSNIIADSGEGYKNRQDCLDMVQSIFTNLDVIDEEGD